MLRMVRLERLRLAAVVCGLLLSAAAPARAALLLSEGFDDLSALTDWTVINNSEGASGPGWFQGNPGVFSAETGDAEAYAATNYLSSSTFGLVSTWLILPELALGDAAELSFYTKSAGTVFQDTLSVLFAPGSGSDVGTTPTSVGDFTTVLLTINPTFNSSYPSEWTQYTVTLSGLGTGQLAFQYALDSAVQGDYLGIDSVTVNSVAVNAVPEPATLTLVGLGLAGLVARKRRQTKLAQAKLVQRGA